MDREEIFYKNRFIQIFRDHWSPFEQYHPEYVDEVIAENVDKMMGCGLIENGYFEYMCLDCQKSKKIGFTCKSRFCLRCAKVYTDNWINKMEETIFPWVSHRHVILTIPGSLWEYFHDTELFKKAGDKGVGTIREVMKISNRGREIEPGIIEVIQSSGRASTWNPHFHYLVTEGGLDKDGHWHDVTYLDYRILRMKWMYNLLTVVKEHFPGDRAVEAKVNEIYRARAKQGLIARAKKEKITERDIVGYLIKYVASPPIALSRITRYDGERVTYWYREHPTDMRAEITVSAFEFIRRMIQHIMPKQFKMVRHYGLYARNKVTKIREALKVLFEVIKVRASEGVEKLLSQLRPNNYRERIIEFFGKDPLMCCGKEMELWSIWHPKYGVVYDFCRDSPEAIEEDVREGPREGSILQREDQLSLRFVQV